MKVLDAMTDAVVWFAGSAIAAFFGGLGLLAWGCGIPWWAVLGVLMLGYAVTINTAFARQDKAGRDDG